MFDERYDASHSTVALQIAMLKRYRSKRCSSLWGYNAIDRNSVADHDNANQPCAIDHGGVDRPFVVTRDADRPFVTTRDADQPFVATTNADRPIVATRGAN